MLLTLDFSKHVITMKKILITSLLSLLCIFVFPNSSYSQYKAKRLKKEIKSFTKQGYSSAPDALPMEKQIEKSWMRQYEKDRDGHPLYIVASGISIGKTQSAAKLQATELAKQELAGTISANVAALIKNMVSNDQCSEEEANTLTKTLFNSKNVIARDLGRVLPLFEIYKKQGNNTKAVVRIAYNAKIANDVAKKTLRKELEKETEMTRKRLDKLMNFDSK